MGGSRIDESRRKLEQLAGELRKLVEDPKEITKRVDSFVPIPFDLAKYLSDALNRYLRGEVKSLDKALGVSRPAHRPASDPEKHEEIARKIHSLALQEKGWGEIASELPKPDIRTLQRIYKKWGPLLMAEEYARRIVEGIEAPHDRSEAKFAATHAQWKQEFERWREMLETPPHDKN